MEVEKHIVANHLTKKISSESYLWTLALIAFVQIISMLYWIDALGAKEFLSASGEWVFTKHEYWRVFSALFVHVDLGHYLSNLFLLVPFSLFLMGHFSRWFFPVAGIVSGAIVNLIVLHALAPDTQLLGFSGVVYWMGGAYLTLALFIENRDSFHKRLIRVIGISLILFFPMTLQKEVSYLSHFLGFVFGVISATVYYLLNKKKFDDEVVFEYTYFYSENDHYPGDYMKTVTLKGNTIEVNGDLPKIGSESRDFSLVSESLVNQSLRDFAGKRKVLNIFPSIDTPTCATSVRKFNTEASQMNNVVVLNISQDLPFAAKRFCAAEGLSNVVNLSTFRDPSFLKDFGVQIGSGPLTGLCARAVIVLDEKNIVKHVELVNEIGNEPNYEAALKVLK